MRRKNARGEHSDANIKSLCEIDFSWLKDKAKSQFSDQFDLTLENTEIQLLWYDFVIFVILLVLSFITHFYTIDYPAASAFDESFFGNFTNYYIQKTYFFDIHPPLGKLILYYSSQFNGYEGRCKFGISAVFENCGHEKLRKANAFWASFCAPLIYLALRIFGITCISSLSGAFMILFEDSMIIEGKFALTDGILHAFTCLSILSMGVFFRAKMRTLKWEITFLIMSFCVSFTACIKQTAWSLFPISILVCIIRLYYNYIPKSDGAISLSFCWSILNKVLKLACVFVPLYIVVFCVHISILPDFGPGSYNICPDAIGNPNNTAVHWKKCTSDPLLKQVFYLIYTMNRNNMRICAEGGITSRWHQWPFMNLHLITFLYNNENSQDRRIYLHINLANSCICLISVAISLIVVYFALFVHLSPSSTNHFSVLLIFLFGYVASYLPFHFVPRPTYLYHYIIPLIFAILLTSVLLDFIGKKYPFLHIVFGVLVPLSSFLFFYRYLPWIYGFNTNKHSELMLNKGWQQT